MFRATLRALTLLTLLLGLGIVAQANTIHVPADQPTIAAAIAAAANFNDTIVVADGTYYEHNLDFGTKWILVQSASGDPAQCIIDCQQGAGFTIHVGTLSGFTIRNAGDGRFGSMGAGLSCDGGNPMISHCIFAGNQANLGGAMFFRNASPTVTDCLFIGNSGGGGGIYTLDSTMTLTDCTFSANSGGAMTNTASASFQPPVTLTNCVFSGNPDGGIVNFGVNINLTNCTFTGNSGTYGGAMHNESNNNPFPFQLAYTTATLTNCTFTQNTASYGGGIFQQSGSLSLNGCTFTQNTATSSGGGVYNTSDSLSVVGCAFTKNSALSGGGISNTDSGRGIPSYLNCLFSGNSGGGLFNTAPYMAFQTNCAFVGNDLGAFAVGGFQFVTNCTFSGNTNVGLYVTSNAWVSNCIFWGDGFELAYAGNPLSSLSAVSHSDIQGGFFPFFTDMGGNTNDDPLFVRAPFTNGPDDFGDLHLQAGSPAIDTGDDTALPAGTTTDLDGNPRILRAHVDMGAYEYQAQGPVANNQSLTLKQDTSLAITLIASDTTNEPLTYAIQSGPTNGTLTGTAPNLTYTPNAGFFGTDSFTFTASTPSGAVSNVATVTLTIKQTLPPVANAGDDQTLAAPHDGDPNTNTTSFTLSGLASSDPHNLVLTFQWQEGSTILGSAPTLSLTRTPGTYTFTLTVTNTDGLSNSATVHVTVLPEPNAPPVANAQSVTTNEDTPVSFTLAGSDPDGDPITYQVVSQPQHGLLIGTAPNLYYLPDNDYNGSDSFTFSTTDSYGATNTASISITVTPVNDPPVAYSASYSTNTNTALTLTLPASDADGDPLTYTIVSSPSHGKLTGTGAVRTYKPATGFNGTDTFTFKVNDGHADSNIATVTLVVSAPNRNPKAVADSASTKKGVPVTIAVMANDSDPDGDTLTVKSITQPGHGTTTLNADGTVTYTPKATFTGKDTFKYTIRDGRGGTASATVTVTVTK